MYNYFEKFPVISYLDNPVYNILASVKFNEITKKSANIFYPYTILEGQRADTIANFYYDDPRYSWIIYLANDILDPYHEWPLFDREFNDFIVKKYGSIDNAYNTPLFYRVNWYGDDSILTPAQYDALITERKKYWAPELTTSKGVIQYVRKKIDLSVETNQIVQLTFTTTSPEFIVGEKITQTNVGTLVGSGYVKAVFDNIVLLQYISGTFVATSSGISTTSSKSNITITNSSTNKITSTSIIATDIPTTEAVYWEMVNAFDYENELNESKKHIRLIDKSFVEQVEEELKNLLTPA